MGIKCSYGNILDYRGEVRAMFECKPTFKDNFWERLRWLLFGNVKYKVRKGDRICQMLIKKNETATLSKSGTLSTTKRGTDGFGSTGK